ncbi:MAG: hypothetical protein DMF53_02575 [Acidobacteria bacterium]|nr:MAG: hypothetical protein DMF53_02575 [Acidobacteriota bacterium]
MLVAINQRDLARLALLRAIGADFDAGLELTDDWTRAVAAPPALPAALDAARRQRPELSLLNERLRLANLNIEAARAERLPTVGAQAQGTESGNRVRDIEWSRTVAAVVNVPLFTGRRIEAHVAAAQAQRDQILIQQNDTQRQVEQEVRRALLVYESARSRRGWPPRSRWTTPRPLSPRRATRASTRWPTRPRRASIWRGPPARSAI